MAGFDWAMVEGQIQEVLADESIAVGGRLVILARQGAKRSLNSVKKSREYFRGCIAELEQRFEAEWGKIMAFTLGNHANVGVVLTHGLPSRWTWPKGSKMPRRVAGCKPRLEWVYEEENSEETFPLKALMNDVHDSASDILVLNNPGVQFQAKQDMVAAFSVAISALDAQVRASKRGDPPISEATFNYVKDKVEGRRVALSLAFRRHTNTRYLVGASISLGFVLALIFALNVTFRNFEADFLTEIENRRFLGYFSFATSAAAMGAAASVYTRLNKETKGIQYHIDHSKIMLWGALRVFLGVSIGIFVVAAIVSRVLPLEVPSEVWPGNSFLYVLGFASGFGERFATNWLGFPDASSKVRVDD